MATFEIFKDELLAYLYAEQRMEKHDIELTKQMSRDDKIEANIIVPNLTVERSEGSTVVLKAPENYSKLRSGDKVIVKTQDDEPVAKAMVTDVGLEAITIDVSKELAIGQVVDIEIESPNLLNSLIGCLEGILPATPGAAFIRMLAGERSVVAEDFLKLESADISGFAPTFALLNSEQQESVQSMLEAYPIHLLQGPPGTGKTRVLAAVAVALSLAKREVVVIANTHQAVNNALLKIQKQNKHIPLFKIGELLKAEELGEGINKFQTFSEYNEYSRKNLRKKRYGYVIGMTIWGAISYLGLRTHSHFRPYMALVDEASLMPLTYASVLGKCASSICLFGDSRQMPPIFRNELEENKLSISILDYCEKNVKGVPVKILPVTHRMNAPITEAVSRAFYEPHGIRLKSAESVAARTFESKYFEQKGLTESIVFIDPEISTPHCEEENEGEARAVVELVETLICEGHRAEDMAVITPFRRQVRLLRAIANERLDEGQMPLIDTVERLQGQDVDCIIMTFAASDINYINDNKLFLFSRNRLNVMISRAKTKVVIFASQFVLRELQNII